MGVCLGEGLKVKVCYVCVCVCVCVWEEELNVRGWDITLLFPN